MILNFQCLEKKFRVKVKQQGETKFLSNISLQWLCKKFRNSMKVLPNCFSKNVFTVTGKKFCSRREKNVFWSVQSQCYKFSKKI